jgi:hypothetical protein
MANPGIIRRTSAVEISIHAVVPASTSPFIWPRRGGATPKLQAAARQETRALRCTGVFLSGYETEMD